jgi:hypothetical protein
MRNAAKARKAAEELGTELAQRGARLLVYGGPFLEADVKDARPIVRRHRNPSKGWPVGV